MFKWHSFSTLKISYSKCELNEGLHNKSEIAECTESFESATMGYKQFSVELGNRTLVLRTWTLILTEGG